MVKGPTTLQLSGTPLLSNQNIVNKQVSINVAAPVYTWIMGELQKYDAQELVPASSLMIAKIKDYFNLAVNLLNDINISIEEVLQMLTDAAKGFSTDSFYTKTQASKKKGNTEDDSQQSTISSALFIKKKMKILLLQEEITVYLDSECEEEACDPLAYWKCNSKRFLSLSRMAQTYLAVLASSIPCE
ncbi:Zinc finger BED domain-containing protein 4 [Puccinia graminis f. sp. tritici]|uniref:Zinc finger BED domain-containing protein 4 n=1 Tax=Puccinia graminis f. sp. tritici TaxID=56615 RepID=A0A5B0PQT4_PUCGR|nr:Zinc finger BED domain-containing protein 4 [Puccinia graminis f. sp. tritici]